MYLFTKARSIPYEGIYNVYGVRPFRGPHGCYRVGGFTTNNYSDIGSITGAAINDAENKFAFLSYGAIYLYHNSKAPDFQLGSFTDIVFDFYGRREAIDSYGDHTLYYTQEAWGNEPAALYKVSVDPSLDIKKMNKPSLTYHDGWISIEDVNTNEYLYIYNVIGQHLQSINKSKMNLYLD